MYCKRLPRLVHPREYGGVDPVIGAVLCPVPDLVPPHPAAPYRLPQVPEEFLGMMPGIDDPVVLPEQLLARVLRNRAEPVVGEGYPPCGVGDRHYRVLVDRGPQVPELGQGRKVLPLDPLLLGDLAGDLGGAHNPAIRVEHRGDRHQQVDKPAVLAPAHRLEAVDARAPADPVDDPRLLLCAVVGYDERDGAADGLLGRVAEDPLGAPVPAADDAVQVLAHDGVARALDDRLGKRDLLPVEPPAGWGRLAAPGLAGGAPDNPSNTDKIDRGGGDARREPGPGRARPTEG